MSNSEVINNEEKKVDLSLDTAKIATDIAVAINFYDPKNFIGNIENFSRISGGLLNIIKSNVSGEEKYKFIKSTKENLSQQIMKLDMIEGLKAGFDFVTYILNSKDGILILESNDIFDIFDITNPYIFISIIHSEGGSVNNLKIKKQIIKKFIAQMIYDTDIFSKLIKNSLNIQFHNNKNNENTNKLVTLLILEIAELVINSNRHDITVNGDLEIIDLESYLHRDFRDFLEGYNELTELILDMLKEINEKEYAHLIKEIYTKGIESKLKKKYNIGKTKEFESFIKRYRIYNLKGRKEAIIDNLKLSGNNTDTNLLRLEYILQVEEKRMSVNNKKVKGHEAKTLDNLDGDGDESIGIDLGIEI